MVLSGYDKIKQKADRCFVTHYGAQSPPPPNPASLPLHALRPLHQSALRCTLIGFQLAPCCGAGVIGAMTAADLSLGALCSADHVHLAGFYNFKTMVNPQGPRSPGQLI